METVADHKANLTNADSEASSAEDSPTQGNVSVFRHCEVESLINTLEITFSEL